MASFPTQPTQSGVCGKVPQIMQLEALECGAAALAMVCAYYGKWIPLERVRKDCGVSRDGSKASSIVKAARSYGFEVRAFRANSEGIRQDVSYPCIIHWGFSHFVVLRGFRKGYAIINDPALGESKVPGEVFDESFTGVVLCLNPGPDFVQEGAQSSVIGFFKERMSSSTSALVLVALATALVGILGLISPLLSETFADKIVGGQNPNLITPFFIALVSLSILQVICSYLSSRYLLRTQGKLAVTGAVSFMWHTLHLPIDFFNQRSPGDIANRLNLNGTVAATIAGQLAPLAIQCITAIVCLILMVVYNVWLAMLGIVACAVKIIFGRLISKKRMNSMRVMNRDAANMTNATIEGFRIVETLKATGATKGFFQRWSGYQASNNTHKIEIMRLNYSWGLVPTAITKLLDASVIILGVTLIIQGHFTIGAFSAFQGILSMFSSPLESIIQVMQSLQESRVDMERIEDVMHYATDHNSVDTVGPIEGEKIVGRVELENITFGYARTEEPLLKNFSLKIEEGSSIAIVGPSGCGKSTLIKLIAGLYSPWEGHVSFDGVPLCQIPKEKRCSSIAVVNQEVVLFDASITDNLTLWDDSIPDYSVIIAARNVGMHEEIMKRPGGYEHIMAENGSDFSGGQRQRLEIARALAIDPTIMIMDEATSALDAKTELEVLKAVKRNGITTIMVTHRLSAIRDCNQIIVLDKGEIVQKGTHEQLMAEGGMYFELVVWE